MASLSRQLARWVVGLRYDDLPPEVVDRAKGVTLQALSSALAGHRFDDARSALTMMREEENGGGGACTEGWAWGGIKGCFHGSHARPQRTA